MGLPFKSITKKFKTKGFRSRWKSWSGGVCTPQIFLEMFLVEFKLGGTFLIELIAEPAELFG